MMRHLLAPLLVSLLLAAPARAAEPSFDRGWTDVQLEPGALVDEALVAPSGLGESAVAYLLRDDRNYARVLGEDGWRGLEPISPVGYVNVTGIDGSLLHGAVSANTDSYDLRVAEVPAGGDRMTHSFAVPAAFANYSYDRPVVKFGPSGEVVVAYLGSLPGDLGPRVMALVRDPGGAWSQPVPVTEPGPQDSRFARSVAVGADGTIVVGLVVDGRVRVATRPPGGAFSLSEPLGGSPPQHAFEVPRVGIDSAGVVVVAWAETEAGRETMPVKIAFRRADANAFGSLQDTGLRTNGSAGLEMGVSLPGEVVLVVESRREDERGWYYDGLHSVVGLTRLERVGAPVRLAERWATNPSFDMNPRGDAVLVWDDCCNWTLRARRRLPMTGFGPPVDLRTLAVSGPTAGMWPTSAAIDEYGNARVSWLHWGTDDGGDGPVTTRYYVSSDGPLIDSPPPAVSDSGGEIPPVIAAEPHQEEETEQEEEVDPPPTDPPATDPPATDPPATDPPASDPPASDPDPVQDERLPELPALPPVPVPAATPESLLPSVPADRRPPRLTLRTSPPDPKRRVRVVVSCDETCAVRLRLRSGPRRGRVVDVRIAAHRRRALTLSIPRSSRRKLRVEGVVTDAAGNFAPFDRPVRRR